MALVDMVVYNETMNESVIETIAQNLNVVNAQSNGAIQVAMDGFEGDFMKNAIYASFAGDVYDVDRYAANNTRAATAITQIEKVGVKAAAAIKKFFEPAQMSWMLKNPEEGIEVASRGIADASFQYVFNNSINALVAAIENNAAAVNDVSATEPTSQRSINGSHAKFGDMAGTLVTQVMHSFTYHKLIDEALVNSAQLWTAGNVTFLGVLGKTIIVTDAPALLEAGTPDKDKVLSLAAGALVISGLSDSITAVNPDTTKDRAETVIHNDFTYGVAIKGKKWDVSAGGASPLSAELATGTNWPDFATDIKHTAGVMSIGDQAL